MEELIPALEIGKRLNQLADERDEAEQLARLERRFSAERLHDFDNFGKVQRYIPSGGPPWPPVAKRR